MTILHDDFKLDNFLRDALVKRGSKKNRLGDDRRRYLISRVILLNVLSGDLHESVFFQLMDESLTKAEDRALFGLPKRV